MFKRVVFTVPVFLALRAALVDTHTRGQIVRVNKVFKK
jgi:hypothetical protein